MVYLSDGHAILEITADTSTAKTIDMAVSVDQKIVEVSTNYTASLDDDIILASGSITITYPDPALAVKSLTVRSLSGNVTLASSGPIEATLLTTSQSATQVPSAAGWFVI